MILQKTMPEYTDEEAADIIGRAANGDLEAQRLMRESTKRHPPIFEADFWKEHLSRSSGKSA
jgi:hypothetical protein